MTETATQAAPSAPPPHWGRRRTVAAAGVAALIAVFGGGAIYAATEHAASGPDFAARGHHGPGPGGGPLGGPVGGMPSETPLHGEFVYADGPGSYATVVTQTGTVTALSADSITVRSQDAFAQTYALDAAAAAATRELAVNDQVMLRALRSGHEATVASIEQR